jgi:membrane associated rhomboid family serine protease
MLFPIGDDNSARRITPVVTWTLIAINVLVFIYQMNNPEFTYGYSYVPAEITQGRDFAGSYPVAGGRVQLAPGPTPIYLTLLFAMFMHGDIMHIGGNMLYLWIFGDNVEDRMGHVRFLIFYLLTGLLASAAQIFFGPNSMIPNLGASGAICESSVWKSHRRSARTHCHRLVGIAAIHRGVRTGFRCGRSRRRRLYGSRRRLHCRDCAGFSVSRK